MSVLLMNSNNCWLEWSPEQVYKDCCQYVDASTMSQIYNRVRALSPYITTHTWAVENRNIASSKERQSKSKDQASLREIKAKLKTKEFPAAVLVAQLVKNPKYRSLTEEQLNWCKFNSRLRHRR